MNKLRLFLFTLLLAFIFILACFYIVPGGKIKYQHDFTKKYYNILGGKGFFNKFGPAERLLGDNKIIGDPAYFYLATSRTFSNAKLKIKYRLSPKVLEENKYLNIEAGVLVDKNNWRYDLKPVFNSALNNIFNDKDFNVFQNDNLIFAQKKSAENFSNYQSFLASNKYQSALFYNYYPDFDFRIQDSFSQDGISSTGYFRYDVKTNLKNLRGSYLFYTYIKDENLAFDFNFQIKEALKKLDEKQDVAIFVYYQNEAIFNDSFQVSPDEKRNYNLNLASLPEGAYKIELKTSDDVITRELKTDLNKVSFLNRVWVDELSNGFALYSNKNTFRVKSVSADCLGELKINNQSFQVNKIYQQFIFSSDRKQEIKALNKIESNSCGLLIENNGLFSFSEISFMNPLLNKLDQDSNIDNFDYILADYRKPILVNDIYTSELDFTLNNAYRDKDGYRFLISAPFLTELDQEKYLEIVEVEVKLQGRTIWEKISSMF